MTILRIFSCAIVIFFVLSATLADAQNAESRQIIVQAEEGELPSAYGAPPDLSHGRISTLTKSYVLAPFSFEVEAGYEGDIFRHGLPAQLFRSSSGSFFEPNSGKIMKRTTIMSGPI